MTALNIFNPNTGVYGYTPPGAALPPGFQSYARSTPSVADTAAAGGTILASSGKDINPHDAPGYDPASNTTHSVSSIDALGNATGPAPSNVPVPPTITTSSLTAVQPVSVPAAPPSTAAAGMSGLTTALTEQAKTANAAQAAADAAKQNVDSSKSGLSDTFNKIFGIQSSQLQTEANAGLPQKQQAVTDATNKLEASQRAQTNELRALDNQFMSPQAKTTATADINHRYAFEQADLALIQSAANRDLDTASNIINRKVQLQLAPLQTQLQYLTQFYNDNKDTYNKLDQRAFETKIAQTKQAYDTAQTGYTQVGDAIKAVLTTGQSLTPTILAQLNNAKNGTEAYQILSQNGVSLQAQKFVPLPFGSTTVYSPLTGETKTIGAGGTNGSTVADRNNNPGNLRGPDGNFRTFNSQAEGQQALIADLTAKMTGATSTGLTANSTLADLAKVWAPASDGNNPVKYAQNLAAQLGVPVNTPIGTLLPRVNEVAAAFARNEGGTYVDPQLPLKYASTYAISLTPEQAASFSKIPEADKQTVAQVLSGRRDITSITSRSGYNQQILNYANSVDPTFNAVAAQAGQKFQLSSDTQKFIANANTASNTVDKILQLSQQVDRGNIQVLNNGVLKLKQGVSDPKAVELVTTAGLLADELGKILGSSQGTDFTIQLGQSLVNPNLSKEAFAAQVNLLKDRIGNKLSEYQKQFGQGTGDTPTPAINKTNTTITGLQVTLPDGSVATFPTQDSLNKFKQDHGL